ncbi:MAG: BMP family ABC transporter substrate-binding protein [Eubacteriales bacterium]|nr:BMP family ABC transporter substrate-binding protein [Eubacteriales bacterium]
MKKILALVLSTIMVMSLVACGTGTQNETTKAPETTVAETQVIEETTTQPTIVGKNVKVGVILVGDENEGYTYSHINGIQNAIKALGLDEKTNVIWKYSIGETEACYDACIDLVEQGCNLVVTNSYGHQSYAEQAASENPNVQFVSMTGDTAKKSGLKNFHNVFTKIYEARYVGGIVAGLKLKELVDAQKLTEKNYDTDGNIKIGYVGAYPYAEVVSGYTAFFLGIRSIVQNVAMDVQYTNSWFNITAESEAAVALMDRGCVIIGQHADSTGAPSACEERLKAGQTVYCVGYNVDMLKAAPDAALTSPTNNWEVFYEYAIGSVMNNQEFAQNWAEGYETNSVMITELGSSCAAGTKEAVDQAVADIKAGTKHVFDTKTFTVGGAEVKNAFASDTNGDFTNDADEAIIDGYYHESYFQSAPSFSLRIDGIKELN